MENKLLELKEQFCRWYCPNKIKVNEYRGNCPTNLQDCFDCGYDIYCNDKVCQHCMVDEYILYIRDDINKK